LNVNDNFEINNVRFQRVFLYVILISCDVCIKFINIELILALDVCSIYNITCSYACISDGGSFSCACPHGYEL